MALATVTSIRAFKEESAETTLHSLAKEALDKANGDKPRAMRLVRKRLEDDTRLQKNLIDDMIDLAISTAVRQAQHGQRARAKQVARADDTSGLRAVAANIRSEMFLNYGISTGGVLGDATKEVLIAERDAHWDRAKGSQKMGEIMHFIARKLEKRTVRQQFSEEDLVKIFAKFQKD